ncbi:MAG: hypothetical protein H0X50_09570 [Nitrosopumilus sp.]|nr:hypothetical protein [Nitrosopumilus sp.]
MSFIVLILLFFDLSNCFSASSHGKSSFKSISMKMMFDACSGIVESAKTGYALIRQSMKFA